jgi:2-polyprenyl-3-methyl-5-hydroxy-6-metoxy-1,4-benzoquinol methylase
VPVSGAREVCRSCGHPLTATFIDLGLSPLSNALTLPENLAAGEMLYPLHVYVCDACFLLQLAMFAAPDEIFRDYTYFSSYSTTWLAHAEAYVREMIETWGMTPERRVVEIASNDGYLLQYFIRAGFAVTGIEPAINVAEVARKNGIPTISEFFGVSLARQVRAQQGAADLIVCNNVLAHVPDINDFTGGLHDLLADDGLITIEFPHAMRMIAGSQFDTVYHEHFSYLSLTALTPLFARHGLQIVDVTEQSTHGGSLRIFIAHHGRRSVDARVTRILDAERSHGMDRLDAYRTFGADAERVKREFLTFLIEARTAGKSVCGYGAAAKATTLLNYAGVRTDLISSVADKSEHKQGRYIPGVRVPIVTPDALREQRPDYVVIFPWNIAGEVKAELADVRSWGGRFVTAVPRLIIDP